MYKKILDGSPEPFRTGMPIGSQAFKDGFDCMTDVIDAPEGIPSGGVYCIEWDNHIHIGERSWFPSQIITIRGM